MADLAALREAICEASAQVVRSGIMTKSNHGNLSMKVPDRDAFLLTAGGSLASMRPENVALFALDGALVEGTVAPVGAEIIQMHGIVYRTRPEFGSVLHTHSPFATGWAVAGKMIPPAYEAMVRGGMLEGVPLAGYGPRGSDLSVRNIETVLKGFDAIRGCLLENHGVLTWGDSLEAALRANMTIEESAEICLYAQGVGGAKNIPAEMIGATRERAASFAEAGTYSRQG